MKQLVIISILGIMTIFGFLLLKSIEEEEVVSLDTSTAISPIINVYGVSATYFDKNERIKYSVISPHVIEYSNAHGTEFVKPEFKSFEEDERLSWQSVSEKGYLSGDKNFISLTKNVKIIQSPNDKTPVRINGEVMYYEAPTNQMSSNKPVMVDNGVTRQNMINFSLNTKTKILNMNGGVNANIQSVPQ